MDKINSVMRTSIPTILCFLLSIFIMIWGAMVVVGSIDLQIVPERYDYLNIPSLAIVIGGVLTSVFISTPFRDVITSLKNCFRFFSQHRISEESLQSDIEMVLDWKRMMSSDRNRSIMQLKNDNEGTFEGLLFSILDTNYPIETVREIGESNIEENFSRKSRINQIVAYMGRVSPVFGMLGTLFGLIVILSGFEEFEYLLSGLAAALMTTFYGIVLGSLIFLPVSRKLENSAMMEYFREKLILEGLLLILEDKSTLQIYDRLTAHVRTNDSNRL